MWMFSGTNAVLNILLQFVAVACLLAVVQAAKLGKSDEPVAIISSNLEVEADGSYKFEYV